MLVHCAQCGVSFDHARGRCIACDATYEPVGEDRISVFASEVENWMNTGATQRTSSQRLIDELGATPEEATRAVSLVNSRLGEEFRQRGVSLTIAGVVLITIGIGVSVLPLVGAIAGLACIVVGGVVLLNGLVRTWTGCR